MRIRNPNYIFSSMMDTHHKLDLLIARRYLNKSLKFFCRFVANKVVNKCPFYWI